MLVIVFQAEARRDQFEERISIGSPEKEKVQVQVIKYSLTLYHLIAFSYLC